VPSRSANDIKIDARITYDAADGLAGRVHAEADATINAAKRVQDAARRAYAAAEGGHLEEAETGLTEAKIDLVKAAAGAAAGDPKDEWKECRTSIDRFDRLLVELRKTGFGFVTAIASASAFLLGPTTPVSTSSTPLIKVGVFFIITLLIVTLFAIDRAHQVWLAAAVQRAKFLEESTLQYWITRNISDKFT